MSTLNCEAGRDVGENWRLSDACAVGGLLFAMVIAGLVLEFTLFRNSLWILAHTRFQGNQAFALSVSVVQLLSGGFAVARIAKVRNLGTPLASIGWNFTNSVTLWSLLGFALAVLVTFVLSVARGSERYGIFPATLLLYLLSSVLAMPFVEECYFRGILFNALNVRISTVGTVVSTSLLFALIHPGHQITILPVAIVLGAVRIRSRSVAACFFVHAAYNLGVFLFPFVW